MSSFNWTCPYCERAVTITADRASGSDHNLWIDNAHGPLQLQSRFFVCPNQECRQPTLRAKLYAVISRTSAHTHIGDKPLQAWNLMPDTRA